MGYPMAKNLRAGLGQDKTMLICDVSQELLDRFVEETQGQGPVEVVSNGFEAAKAAVSNPCHMEKRTETKSRKSIRKG
jgi:3-hydroxyisobutyrate dehydrogenase